MGTEQNHLWLSEQATGFSWPSHVIRKSSSLRLTHHPMVLTAVSIAVVVTASEQTCVRISSSLKELSLSSSILESHCVCLSRPQLVSAAFSRYILPIYSIQGLQKIFTPLDFFHILLYYSLNLKLIEYRFCVTGLITHNVKVKLCF